DVRYPIDSTTLAVSRPLWIGALPPVQPGIAPAPAAPVLPSKEGGTASIIEDRLPLPKNVQSKTGRMNPDRVNLDILVHFDRTSYTLRLLPTKLTYQDYAQSYEIPLQECSQAVINEIVSSYAQLEADYNKDKNSKRVKTEYDVVVQPSQGSSYNVSRNSNFGTWLRDIPAVISYRDVEAAVACVKKQQKTTQAGINPQEPSKASDSAQQTVTSIELTVEGSPGQEFQIWFRANPDSQSLGYFAQIVYTGEVGPQGSVTISVPRAYLMLGKPVRRAGEPLDLSNEQGPSKTVKLPPPMVK
ncbi:MAG TPA: hypothetical protein VIG95_01235, partial [Gemmatimonadales bacterium]